MFISYDSNPIPPIITARWRRGEDEKKDRLVLTFGSNMSVVLTVKELLELDKVIAGAFDDGPLSLDQATEKAHH